MGGREERPRLETYVPYQPQQQPQQQQKEKQKQRKRPEHGVLPSHVGGVFSVLLVVIPTLGLVSLAAAWVFACKRVRLTLRCRVASNSGIVMIG